MKDKTPTEFILECQAYMHANPGRMPFDTRNGDFVIGWMLARAATLERAAEASNAKVWGEITAKAGSQAQ